MATKNRNKLRLTRLVLLRLPWILRFFGQFRTPSKRMLVIKIDAIGDYVIFRNFLSILKLQYQDHQIDLLGNTAWKDLAESLDHSYINEFIYIKPSDQQFMALASIKLGWHLFKNNYSLVINPTFSRTLLDDGFAGMTGCRQITGYLSNTENIKASRKKIADKFYREKYILPEHITFEFDKDLFFFEKFLVQEIALAKPFIQHNIDKTDIIIVFPGSGSHKRSWEIHKFAELIQLLIGHTPYTIYIAGGPAELSLADYLTANVQSPRLINRVGQTSLTGLVDMIAAAKLVISNETSAVHIASACGTHSVCVLGGGHFERFTPYPNTIPNRPECVYRVLPCFHCNWHCIYKTNENEPYPCISQLTVQNVWDKVKPIIFEHD